ncbi:MAG: ferrous iron transport protein A [Chloroflexi bacterium]|nr:ferrous iron transport protein A [Chloroflexota bacterium]
MNEEMPEILANAECPQPFICPLSHVRAGSAVRIKQLTAPPEVTHRLREMGFCEEQKVKLLSQQTNIICQVCNVRLGISPQLAEQILVQPLSAQQQVA